MNRQQRKNLKTLADELERQVVDDEFDMRDYLSANNGGCSTLRLFRDMEDGVFREFYLDGTTVPACGTVGCAVGWGPFLHDDLAPDVTKDLAWDGSVEYSAYGERVFGVNFDSDEFNWMFDAYWGHTDNTVGGAVARIRWYLKHGVPDEWWDQRGGHVPLCYV